MERVRESKRGWRAPTSNWTGSRGAHSYTRLSQPYEAPKSSVTVTQTKPIENKSGTESKKDPITSAVSSTSSYRRLTDEEVLRKRELGLCFRCDEKFGPNHRCKRKELKVLILSKDTGDVGDAEAEMVEEEAEDAEPPLALSMNSLVGIDGNKTMRLKGRIK